MRSSRRGGTSAVVAVVVAVTVLAACTVADEDGTGARDVTDDESVGGDPADDSAPAEPADEAAPVGESGEDDDLPASGSLDDYRGQELDWSPCFRGLECTRVLAPLDWADPAGLSIELFVSRLPATGTSEQRIGSLLLNPGGPGGSGVRYLNDDARQQISPRVREHYDLVGFDPRGVGLSTPVECGDAPTNELLDGLPLTTDDEAGIEQARQHHRQFGAACLEASGDLLGHVDTASAARDMDLLRVLLGDEQLFYLGYSYGTFLGATYAELFPEQVGRLVLDSAVDYSLTTREMDLQQAEALETALRDFVEDCQASGDCPLTGSVEEGMTEFVVMVEARDAEPIELPGGPRVTGSTALRTVYGLVTAADAAWADVTWLLEGWDDAARWAEWFAQAESDFDPFGGSAFWRSRMAVDCLDHPTPAHDLASALELQEELAEVAPTLGHLLAPSRAVSWTLGCGEWPVAPVREPAQLRASGAAPILVVGVAGDRRTPYEWSVSLAEQLESGVLITWEGDRHGGYGYADDCLHDVVDAYLIDGVLPDDGTVC